MRKSWMVLGLLACLASVVVMGQSFSSEHADTTESAAHVESSESVAVETPVAPEAVAPEFDLIPDSTPACADSSAAVSTVAMDRFGPVFCHISYCKQIGIRCVLTRGTQCPACKYKCGEDLSCTAADPLPC